MAIMSSHSGITAPLNLRCSPRLFTVSDTERKITYLIYYNSVVGSLMASAKHRWSRELSVPFVLIHGLPHVAHIAGLGGCKTANHQTSSERDGRLFKKKLHPWMAVGTCVKDNEFFDHIRFILPRYALLGRQQSVPFGFP